MTVDVEPHEGGSVQLPEVLLTTFPSTTSLAAGQLIEVTALPASGFRFESWDGSVTGQTDTITLEMNCTKQLTAIFVPITYHIKSGVEPVDGGHVVLTPTQPSNDYEVGTMLTATASAESGFKFVGWIGEVSGNRSSIDITVDGDKSITAVFEKQDKNFTWVWIGSVAGIMIIGMALFPLIFRKKHKLL